jgi:ArsR family transcriptional regulator, virulence genes transcriptional regulator
MSLFSYVDSRVRNSVAPYGPWRLVAEMMDMDFTRLEGRADEAARLLTAMSNPKRLMILCNLLEREMNVSELGERVGLAQSPLSQHLSKLRAWKFVSTRRDGQQIHYSLASDEVRAVMTTLYGLYCAD